MSPDNRFPVSGLPIGTVTFLFTDIEGSTLLWETKRGDMSLALSRHDALLLKAIELHGGHVFKTGGDSFYAAFHTATQALMAAIDAQVGLQEEQWPNGLEIRVRMAMHTGTAELRNNDYFGPTLNRTARLLSSCHGGQILSSMATAELIRDSMPADVQLRDLGEHRLKDLIRSERIFQVNIPFLQQEFARLNTLDGTRHNLPILSTSFIGREKELSELNDLVTQSPLTTLTGTGGAGKTRLSLQLCAELVDKFPDGIWFVELAGSTKSSDVLENVASTLGVVEEPGRNRSEALIEFLRDKRILILLDNCEHLIQASAELVASILRRCPNVKVLATSREVLGISGERQYRLRALSTPPVHSKRKGASQSTNEASAELTQYDSVKLFIDRALLNDHTFLVTNANAPAVAEVCSRLDGIPLAIELAAARLGSLTVEEINHRLHDRFKLLKSNNRTVLPRQQTLRALVAWSYDLLNEAEKAVLSWLSVFSGGFDLSMVECMSKHLPVLADELVIDVLSSLVDKSLVLVERTQELVRYRLLQTIREYAHEILVESGELKEAQYAHLEAIYQFSCQAGSQLDGPNQTQWLGLTDLEFDNIRAALTYSILLGDRNDFGIQIAIHLKHFFRLRCHWAEGKSWLEQLLAIPRPPESSNLRSEALMTLGNLCLRMGDYAYAREQYHKSLEIRQGLRSPDAIGSSLHALAHVDHLAGDLITARPLYEQSLAIRRIGKDRLAMTMTLNNLANLLQDLGEFESSERYHQESLAIRREIGSGQTIGQTLQNLGCLALATGNYVMAAAYFVESLDLMLEVQDVQSISQLFQSVGEVASKTDRPLLAAQLWGAAQAYRDQIGAPVYVVDADKQAEDRSHAESLIGKVRFEEEWLQGASLPLEAVVKLARSILEPETVKD